MDLKVLLVDSGVENLLSTQCPKYLFNIIPFDESFYDKRKKQRPFFDCRTDCFKYSFFSNSLRMVATFPRNTKLGVYCSFQSKLLKLFNVNDPEGVKYLTRLHLCFSHLNEHEFRHGFLDTLNPLGVIH